MLQVYLNLQGSSHHNPWSGLEAETETLFVRSTLIPTLGTQGGGGSPVGLLKK